MASFQIGISPSKRAAARFIGAVRRGLQMALTEEGISQSDLARDLGVHRSVISREIRGDKDIGLGRIAELAYLMGRKAEISFPKRKTADGANHGAGGPIVVKAESSATGTTAQKSERAMQGGFIAISKAA